MAARRRQLTADRKNEKKIESDNNVRPSEVVVYRTAADRVMAEDGAERMVQPVCV